MNNIWMTWGDVFNQSFLSLWYGFIQFAPKLIVAIIFFIIGWILGSLVAKAFEQVFSSLKVDKLLQSVKADEFMKRAGLNLNSGYFIGQIVRWFIIIVFLLPSLNLVGLDYISSFLQNDVLGFLPRVVVAAFILIIATVLAEAISKTVVAGSKTVNLKSAHMLGTIAKYAVWVFAFIIAFEQLGIKSDYINTLFGAFVYTVAIALALAFGLGGKDHASRFLSKISDDMRR